MTAIVIAEIKLVKQLAGDRIHIANLLWPISSNRRGDIFAFEFYVFMKLFFGSPVMLLAIYLLLVLG